MFRSVLLNLFIAFYSIGMCMWGMMLSLMDKGGRRVHFYSAVPWARGILAVCGIRVLTKGRERVDPLIPRIYMSNHQSLFDIFVLLASLPVDFKFLMKQELMNIPLLGPTMKKAGYIGIEREDPRKAVQSMAEAVKRIQGGASVLIFPEGTRSNDGSIQDFKKGGFSLALKSGCDIVPVVIRGTREIASKGSWRYRKGNVQVNIGHPIPLEGYSKRHTNRIMERIRQEMIQTMKTLKGNSTT